MFDVRRIEPGVAGTSIGPKSIQWLQLRDRSTGAAFVAANHHLVPTIDNRGRPDRTNPKRVRLATMQLDAAGALVDRLAKAGPLFLTADWNIDARRDGSIRDNRWPFVALGEHGLRSNWRVLGYPHRGTHQGGARLIDYVMSTTRAAVPIRQRILGSYGSDHSAVLVTESNHAGIADTITTKPTPTTPKQLVVPGSNPGSTMTLTGEQVSNAAIIIAEGRAAGIPEYGWVIGLAAALQESGIRMLDYGDRDSVNMFQQRPSSGWGRPRRAQRPAPRHPRVLRRRRPHPQPRPDRHHRLEADERDRRRAGRPALRLSRRVRQVGSHRPLDRAATRRRCRPRVGRTSGVRHRSRREAR